MRSATAATGLVLAAVLALSGCVGIPTSGGVQTGPVIGTQLNQEFVVLPAGPRPGESQEELLADFMQAVRGPQNDYAVARSFLTRNLAGTWDPDASAIIRAASATTTTGPVPNTLHYSLTSKAYVDSEGRYFEQDPASQTLEFGFTQEGGEWRISSAPAGIVLADSSFRVVFTERSLFFFDPSYGYLVPDVRWFPSRSTVPVRIVRALLTGPASWLQQGVVLTAFPTATTLGAATVRVESGTATVDLSKEALTASPQQRERMRQQLSATLGTANVVMTVGGLQLATPDSSGAGAVVNPPVESALLIGTGTAFGFSTGVGVAPIAGISDKVVALGGVGVSLANDKQSAAVLAADGAVYLVRGADPALRVDARGGLAVPSIDPFGLVWSARADSAATLSAFEIDGTEHPVQSGLPADARIVSMDVSRDGTRILLYLSTSVGPRLVVAGIIRQQRNVPTRLGELVQLPVPQNQPIDAAWVDDRRVATVSQLGDAAPVTVIELGGPSVAFGQLADAKAIVGGSGGNANTDGLGVLRKSGEVWRPQGTGGWVATGVTGTFLGTKQ